jgi:hypothetical protein
MDSLTELLIWVLTNFGIVLVITKSSLCESLRKKAHAIHPQLGKLVTCPMCFGFWSGMGLSFLHQPVTDNVLLDGFLGSGTAFILYCLAWKLALHDQRL